MRIHSALLLCGAAIGGACSAPTHVDLVSKQDPLSYLIVTGGAMPDQWTTPEFDDSAWQKASGPIGPIAAGGSDAVMPAVLTRSQFDLGPDSSSYKTLTLKLDVGQSDFTAYVNGTAMTTAQSAKSATLALPPGLVHDSGDMLAVEIHPSAGVTSLAVTPTLDGKVDNSSQTPRIVRGPYLVAPRPDGVSIEWETSAAVASQAVVDGQTLDGGSGTHHEAKATGLQPSHSYPYFVQIDGEQSETSELVTAPAGGGERVRFVLYGDNRTDGDTHRLIAEGIEAEGPDFIVNTGDLVDSSSSSEWQTFFDIEYELLRHVPFFPALGNHEADSGGGGRFAQLFPLGDKSLFGGKVYSADFGDVHLSVLDSNGDLGAQSRWLDKDLTAAEQRGARHEFVIMHWGAYSSGSQLQHGSNDDARDTVVPVARAHKIDALFAGHDHFYERGADGDLRYFVSGGGGAPLVSTGHIAQTQVAHSKHHYVVFDVQGSTVNVTAKDETGAVIDQLTLTSSR
jgi:Calcineurin-like phosphoesterase